MKVVGKFSGMAVTVLTAILLTACGGGGGGGDAPTAPPAPVVTGSATGVLSDAPVGGVAYTTSSGVTGTTAADGSYKFNPGDTVTFKLGAVTLGTVTATGIITPMELSGGSAEKLQNLLVLLQSLDSDGNPANGITIAGGAASALASSVNLGGSTATFAADAALQSAMTAGGIGGTPRTPAQANAHFLAQGMELLSRQVWVSQSFTEGTRTVVLRFNADGSYVHAESGPSDYNGNTVVAQSGIEAGTVTVVSFSPVGFAMTATTSYDGNGEWGASNLRSCDRFRNVGDNLVVGDDCVGDHGTGVFTKMDNDNATIVGAWEYKSDLGVFDLYFFANGRFLVAQGLVDNNGAIVSGGLQAGRYTAAGGNITLFADNDAEPDTTGYTLSADGKTLSIATLSNAAFVRISR